MVILVASVPVPPKASVLLHSFSLSLFLSPSHTHTHSSSLSSSFPQSLFLYLTDDSYANPLFHRQDEILPCRMLQELHLQRVPGKFPHEHSIDEPERGTEPPLGGPLQGEVDKARVCVVHPFTRSQETGSLSLSLSHTHTHTLSLFLFLSFCPSLSTFFSLSLFLSLSPLFLVSILCVGRQKQRECGGSLHSRKDTPPLSCVPIRKCAPAPTCGM